MNFYMLFLRSETIDFASYSPEDMQKILADFDEWNAKSIRDGKLLASGNLSSGKSKTVRNISVVTDGPYSEAKESVTGFFLIRAVDEDEAVRIASGCPFLPRGGSVEVRLIPRLEFEDVALQVMEDHAHERAGSREKGGRHHETRA
jgi:hypothetical protein